ncbi:MAG TPA: VTT domain-containing protein [Pirellulales bacterium]
MSELFRWTIAVTLVLLAPVVPFLLFGDWAEARVAQWLDETVSPAATAGIVTGVLTSDILLPVPSSFVSTLAGSRLGVAAGAAVIWLGMTAGAIVGFALARWLGRPLALRFSSAADLQRMEALAERGGPLVLALTRPLPVLAEASVLLLGAIGLSWRQFLPVVFLANLGLALAYAALGYWAHEQGNLLVALAGSIVVPVLATLTARRWMPTRQSAVPD